MSEPKPVRCQKCGKPLGYVTVLAKGLLGLTAASSKREAGCCLHGMFPEKLEEMTCYP